MQKDDPPEENSGQWKLRVKPERRSPGGGEGRVLLCVEHKGDPIKVPQKRWEDSSTLLTIQESPPSRKRRIPEKHQVYCRVSSESPGISCLGCLEYIGGRGAALWGGRTSGNFRGE